MNQIETNTAVRAWLNGLPGTVQDGCSDAVVRKAWGAFGKGNLEMFRTALAQHGFRPEPLGRVFILRLPSFAEPIPRSTARN
ncbi:MAG: hypothetical protein IH878_10455 [Gemmatimonadetes bacterium]|nr:hypothetical protein [Gemmatimonadota bacterium]